MVSVLCAVSICSGADADLLMKCATLFFAFLAGWLWLPGPIVTGLSAAEEGGEWNQFRGPTGQGHAATAKIPLHWSETQNIRWRTPLPGLGYSSPVVDGNEIWLTTAFDVPSSPEEVEVRTRNNTGSEPITVSDSATMHALCVASDTGKLLHNIELLRVDKPQWVHVQNSYASPTPVIEDDKLYCHFGTFGTVCLDTKTQEIVWTNRDTQVMHENGPASSPVIWGDYLIVHCDGSDQQYIVALDKKTGEFAWKTFRTGSMHSNPQLKKAYGTPLIIKIDGREVIVSPAANWLYGYDPHSGAEIWKVPYEVLGFSIVPRPVADEATVYICTSYVHSELLAFRTDRAGGVPEIKWRYRKGVPQKASPILLDGRLYFVSEGSGVLTCLDTESAEPIWRKRINGEYSASPLATADGIFFFSEEGETTVIAPGEEFIPLAKNKLDGQIFASPAITEDALLIRTGEALYKIESK